MEPDAGDLWLADVGGDRRRTVYVVSSSRFHRLSRRAVIAPVLDEAPDVARPWHVGFGDRVIAVNLLGSTPIDRLLELLDRVDAPTRRRVRDVVRHISD
jgi:mRNA-degrading endonuclease toxin of MazEF toxin-antitoxin module